MRGTDKMIRQLLAGLIFALSTTLAQAEVSSAVRQETRTVQGLAQPAEIILDRWGIPHIYAQSARDAFFLQGYNAARPALADRPLAQTGPWPPLRQPGADLCGPG